MSGSESEDTEEKKYDKRLFIGGLFPEVKDDELRNRFGRFGTVKGTEIKIRRDSNGNPIKTFAYIDLETSDRDFKKCVNTYNKARWKGSELKIQVAKENFLKRLEKERQEISECKSEKDIEIVPVSGIQSKLMAISDIATAANFNMKGATPGTTVPGEEKWIVGKYGRVLPIVHMKKSGASKIQKIDPSKLTHNLRRIKDEKYIDNIDPSKLTWELEEDDNEVSRKRKGEFPEWKPPVKRKRYVNGESSQDDLQKRVMEVVESDKTYRNSDFEVVPVKGKSESARNSFTDLSRFDSDPEDDDVNVTAPGLNNVVDDFMDLSRFNSDSDDEVSNVSYQKAGLRHVGQTYNKNVEKIHGGKGNISVKKSSTNVKDLPRTGPNSIKTMTALKSTENMFGGPQKLIDEYSSGLNELNSGKFNQDFSDGDDDDDDDSDFETLVKKQLKNLKSEKSDTNTSGENQNDSDLSKKQLSSEKPHVMNNSKTDLKAKVVDGKKTLLAFRGTKFLSSDANTGTSLTVVDKSSIKSKEDVVEDSRDSKKNNQKDVSIVSYGKMSVHPKRQPCMISFEKSSSKTTGSRKLVKPNILLDEFSSGLDVTDNTKPGNSSEEEDDDDSDFEKFVKKELQKMESEKKQLDVREVLNSEQLKQNGRNIDKSDLGLVELKKNQCHSSSSSSSSSEDEDSEIGNETDSDDSEESVVVGSKVSKNEEKIRPEKKTVQDGTQESDNCSDIEEGNEDDVSDDDNDDDGDDNDDNDDDCQSDSNSDFETLISKAMKEVQDSGKSNDVSRNISEASVGEDDIKLLNNENKYTRSKIVNKSSSDLDSFSEKSATDDGTGDKVNDNNVCHEVGEKETMSSVSKVHQADHNKFDDDDDDSEDDDSDENNNDCDDDSGDDSRSCEFKDKVAGNDNKNKTLPKDMKNQTLDYSGIMSESSDSDNDTNMESEIVDTSNEEDNSSSDNDKSKNSLTAMQCDTVNKSCTKKNMLKAGAGGKSNIQGMDSQIESRTSSESEDSSSSETESDENTKVKTVQSEKLNIANLNAGVKTNVTKQSDNAKFSLKDLANTNTRLQQIDMLHGKKTVDAQNRAIKTTIQPNTMLKAKFPNLENKADIDKKRLEAVKQRQKEALAQKSLIKNALSNLDASKTANTKIVFDSDSDEDHVAMETDKPTSVSRASEQNRNTVEELKSATKSKTLFDSDDDEDDDDDDTNRFNIRDEFEGAEGRKLAKLQSRFGHDERFKLDARFIESGSEEDDEEGKVDEEDETTRSLKILQSVVGAKAVGAIHKHDKAKRKFKDVGALKYDPAREEHQHFVVKTKPAEQPEIVEKKKKKKKKEDVSMEKEPAVVLPEVSKDKFYEISDSLKKTFVEKVNVPSAATSGGAGFSLLAAFGRHYSDDDDDKADDDEDSAIPIPETLRTNQLSLANRFKVRDDEEHMESDGDHREHTDKDHTKNREEMNTSEQTTKQVPDVKYSSTFFFMQNDKRLNEPSAFPHKENVKTAQEDWLGKRRQLIESYKSKHKNLRRKKVPTHQKRGGKRR